ncbi:MAG: SlyX family protein [Proteobacteria bacterium]|nr:SlyX family protein [Pseudomonadota bacterium]
MNLEDRIVTLEEIVGLQGKTIDDLSDVIADQQKQIDSNERMLKAVATKLHAMYDSGSAMDGPPDEAPPHY